MFPTATLPDLVGILKVKVWICIVGCMCCVLLTKANFLIHIYTSTQRDKLEEVVKKEFTNIRTKWKERK